MHLVLWSAGRRLAVLVSGSMVVVAVSYVSDRPVGPLPAATWCASLLLLVLGLISLARARHYLRQCEMPLPAPHPPEVYRTNAVDRADGDRPIEESGAARAVAIALVVLALSGALTIVAAASR
jgi:hypothetical protein